jgi:hypothetical protein
MGESPLHISLERHNFVNSTGSLVTFVVIDIALENIRPLDVWVLSVVWELHNLYSSPSIVRLIKWRRMRWVGHVARIGNRRCVCVQDFGGEDWGIGTIGRSRGSGRIIVIWNRKRKLETKKTERWKILKNKARQREEEIKVNVKSLCVPCRHIWRSR